MKFWITIKYYFTPWWIQVILIVAVIYLLLSCHYNISINIFYWIAISIVSSYIFYFFLVKIKEVRNKQNIYPAVLMLITRFANRYSEAKKNLGENKDIATKNPFSKTAPLIFIENKQKANWFEYLEHIQRNLYACLNQLMQLLPFLDSKMVKEIIMLQDKPYFQQSIRKEIPIELYLKFFDELEEKIMLIKKLFP